MRPRSGNSTAISSGICHALLAFAADVLEPLDDAAHQERHGGAEQRVDRGRHDGRRDDQPMRPQIAQQSPIGRDDVGIKPQHRWILRLVGPPALSAARTRRGLKLPAASRSRC